MTILHFQFIVITIVAIFLFKSERRRTSRFEKTLRSFEKHNEVVFKFLAGDFARRYYNILNDENAKRIIVLSVGNFFERAKTVATRMILEDTAFDTYRYRQHLDSLLAAEFETLSNLYVKRDYKKTLLSLVYNDIDITALLNSIEHAISHYQTEATQIVMTYTIIDTAHDVFRKKLRNKVT